MTLAGESTFPDLWHNSNTALSPTPHVRHGPASLVKCLAVATAMVTAFTNFAHAVYEAWSWLDGLHILW